MTRCEIFKLLCGPGVDSYNRMAIALGLCDGPLADLAAPDRYIAIGEAWESCDNIAKFCQPLRIYLSTPRREYLDAMMTDAELAAHRALPDVITIYRGCYAINRRGFSWSLDRSIAAQFPFLMRYRRNGDTPLLLTARVRKHRAVLKLGRDEHEVIVPRVHRFTQEVLTPPIDASEPGKASGD